MEVLQLDILNEAQLLALRELSMFTEQHRAAKAGQVAPPGAPARGPRKKAP